MPAVDVAARLSAAPPRNGRFYTVAVDGRGGSGKTTLAERLRELLPGFDVLNGDDYFEPVDSHVVWGEFNEERFLAEVITPLADGDTFTHRRYSWDAGALEPPVPTRVVAGVIVERCFSFDLPLDWDLRIWVEAPADVCLARGLARDLLPADQVLRAWREAWQPREDDYIASRRPEATADVVVDGVRPFGPQLADGILDAVDGTETPRGRAACCPYDAPMQKWEYVTVPLLTHATKQILDNWGDEGYELVAVVPGANAEQLVAYLKRPKA